MFGLACLYFPLELRDSRYKMYPFCVSIEYPRYFPGSLGLHVLWISSSVLQVAHGCWVFCFALSLPTTSFRWNSFLSSSRTSYYSILSCLGYHRSLMLKLIKNGWKEHALAKWWKPATDFHEWLFCELCFPISSSENQTLSLFLCLCQSVPGQQE